MDFCYLCCKKLSNLNINLYKIKSLDNTTPKCALSLVRIGNIVTLFGNIVPDNSNKIIPNFIPEGFRPSKNISFRVYATEQTTSSISTHAGTITPEGNLEMAGNSHQLRSVIFIIYSL